MVNQWENEYIPSEISHPGGTLEDLLEEQGMSQVQLAERTGRPKKTINRIIRGKDKITPETAIQFERVLGTPASFWINRQCQYDELLARKNARIKLEANLTWLKKLPIKEMIQLGWIKKLDDPVETMNHVLSFFGVNSPDQWHIVWQNPEGAFRESPAFKKNPEATSVWLRKGEIDSSKIGCEKYNAALFRESLKEIRDYTNTGPDVFESQIIEKCAASGVAVVFVPLLKGVPVYGVTRWITPEKALIQLSLRGKYEDIFWFTFFHEAAHILKHGKKDVFVETGDSHSAKEKEADLFASSFLIAQKEWIQFIRFDNYQTKSAVCSFADKMGISPAIVVGRLHHEGLVLHSQLNNLRRRFEFKN